MEIQNCGVPPNNAYQNSKFLSWEHEVFEVSEYKRKLEFAQRLGVPKWGGFPQNRAAKIQTFHH